LRMIANSGITGRQDCAFSCAARQRDGGQSSRVPVGIELRACIPGHRSRAKVIPQDKRRNRMARSDASRTGDALLPATTDAQRSSSPLSLSPPPSSSGDDK
jgi:hypothetical protein